MWNEIETKLCIELHNRKIRPEIQVGDWILIKHTNLNDKRKKKWIPGICFKKCNECWHIQTDSFTTCFVDFKKRDTIILLWSWEWTSKWLRGKGWGIMGQTGFPDGSASIGVSPNHKIGVIVKQGQTGVEALLRICISVDKEK